MKSFLLLARSVRGIPAEMSSLPLSHDSPPMGLHPWSSCLHFLDISVSNASTMESKAIQQEVDWAQQSLYLAIPLLQNSKIEAKINCWFCWLIIHSFIHSSVTGRGPRELERHLNQHRNYELALMRLTTRVAYAFAESSIFRQFDENPTAHTAVNTRNNSSLVGAS